MYPRIKWLRLTSHCQHNRLIPQGTKLRKKNLSLNNILPFTLIILCEETSGKDFCLLLSIRRRASLRKLKILASTLLEKLRNDFVKNATDYYKRKKTNRTTRKIQQADESDNNMDIIIKFWTTQFHLVQAYITELISGK